MHGADRDGPSTLPVGPLIGWDLRIMKKARTEHDRMGNEWREKFTKTGNEKIEADSGIMHDLVSRCQMQFAM